MFGPMLPTGPQSDRLAPLSALPGFQFGDSMATSPQDVYATNLQQNRGYPLRIPEPNNTLGEPYNKEGFQIGDVGYVNDYGEFILLLNIGFPLSDELRESGVPPHEPIRLQKPYHKPAALAEDHLFMTGVERHVDESRVAYKFTSTSSAGAILILPSGATLSELQNQRELEIFREVAVKYAHTWCEMAGCDTLYLVTGLYKTRCWTLGSFNKGRTGGGILVERQSEKSGSDTGVYRWKCAFEVDHQPGPKNNSYENQTVFIKGFKMTVRWAGRKLAIIEWVTGSQSTLASFVAIFLALLASLFAISPEWLPRIASVEHNPRLSQPLHPSDLINRYLLDMNPQARVAITHDNEWIDILEKKRLSHSDLMQDGLLREFLAKEYIYHSDDRTVSLQSQVGDTSGTGYKMVSLRHIPAAGNAQIVITHIRAENVTVGLGRIPIGFYVQLDFHGGTSKRTKIKPVPVFDSVIQWDDLIQLPFDTSVTVRLTVCAPFEFSPVLGKGEPLHVLETSVGKLLDQTDPIIFSQRMGEVLSHRSSLIVAVQQWHCNHRMHVSSQVDSGLDWEDSSELAKVTDLGHGALHRYRKDHCKEDLESSFAHFECALNVCPDTHTCRAAVLFNLATVTFTIYQFYGILSSFNRAIALYQETLKLRRDGHPDRPTTLLHLSHALLYYYGTMGYQAPIEVDVRKLVDELMDICPEGSHEHRAAGLTLQTYQWLRIRNSDDFAALDKLIPILDVAAHEPPEAYLDRSIRFHNLGLALLRRFQLHHNLSDLDRAIIWLQETVRVSYDEDLNKPSYLNDLGNALLDRYQRLKDVGDLDQVIIGLEDATRLTPDGHQSKPSYVHNLSLAYLARFQRVRNVGDLGQGTFRFENATHLIPDALHEIKSVDI